MQVISGLAASTSSTLERALAKSTSSPRTSTSSIPVPSTAWRKPAMRSTALSAPRKPTKPMHLPPSGSAFIAISPACTPASVFDEPR